MKVEELPQEGFAECPRYITLMRFAFLTGLTTGRTCSTPG